MTLKNKRAPLLRNIKHCASYHRHMWIKTGVTVWKRLSGVMTSVTLTLTFCHLCYATSTFVNHFKGIGELKLEWQSGNAQNLWFFVPCDLDIWQMTSKNNRTPLQCYFKIWASFHSHLWNQTGVTVWKISIWVKLEHFLVLWPWNLMNDLEKQ